MVELPQSVQRYLVGYRSSGDDLRTSSSAHVYFFRHPQGRGRFLKVLKSAERRSDEAKLGTEKVALEGLRGLSWVANVVYYCVEDGVEYLITEELPGRSSEGEWARADIPGMLRAVAEGLRRIHTLAIRDFALDGSVDGLLARLERRVRLNLVGEGELEGVGWRGSAQELLEEMQRRRPRNEERVLTHGDFCLPNVLVEAGQVTGVVDWGHAGVGDRHRDFAAVAMSIGRNYGEEWVEPFFEAYGVGDVDREKLRYHRLLYDLI